MSMSQHRDIWLHYGVEGYGHKRKSQKNEEYTYFTNVNAIPLYNFSAKVSPSPSIWLLELPNNQSRIV